jgi:hypothetical protein
MTSRHFLPLGLAIAAAVSAPLAFAQDANASATAQDAAQSATPATPADPQAGTAATPATPAQPRSSRSSCTASRKRCGRTIACRARPAPRSIRASTGRRWMW